MNRKIFMERLRELLRDIPSEEREEALDYYESYFDEAGIEEESKVIEELESPEKVAKTIKEDLGTGDESLESQIGQPHEWREAEEEFYFEEKKGKERSDKNSKIVLIVVALILTFPIWIALAGLLFGVIAAVFGVLFGGLVGLAGATGGILISGIVLICVGVGGCFAGQPAAGILVLGVGLILAALGLLALICTVWVCAKVIPAVCRGFVHLCQRLFSRKKEGVQ